MIRLVFVAMLLSMGVVAKQITIHPGDSPVMVSKRLQDATIIRSHRLFYLYLRLNNKTSAIQAGQYSFPVNANYNQIIRIITGQVPQLVSVTIPEGFTVDEIIDQLHRQSIIRDPVTFKRHLTRARSDFSMHPHILKGTVASFEGLLFPDTYYMSKNMTYDQIIDMFIRQFDRTLVTIYNNATHPKLSFYNTLILASIIEKEAGVEWEMPRISGVFHNRLRQNIPLSSCPTVGYAMGQPRKTTLTYTDLNYSSPYNTYRNRGLPPTPIASPGKAAFLAALNPEKTKYLYFVSKNDQSGEHVFSTNLRDHVNHQYRIQGK